MAMAPPVWDLLADDGSGLLSEVALVGVVLLGWAFPVYLSARRVLLDGMTIRRLAATARSGKRTRIALYRKMVCSVPIALGSACILAAIFGVDQARLNFAAADFPEAAKSAAFQKNTRSKYSRRIVPMRRSTNGCETGADGTDLISSISSTRKFASQR
jgi:hypothetical protein